MSAWRNPAAAALRAGGPLVVGLVALLLARMAIQPGLAFWDTAEFQAVGPLLGTAHPTGYPAYVILSWLASIAFLPLGEPAYRVNLLSALLFAVACGLAVVLVRELAGRAFVAVGAGLLLALSPLAWEMGTHADPHTLHLALVALLLVLLVGWENRRASRAAGADRWLVASAGVFGVAVANHSLSLLLVPAIGLYVLAVHPGVVLRWRLILACLGLAAVVAGLLYLELPLRAAMGAPLVYGHPDTLEGFTYVVTGEQFRGDVLPLFADLDRKVGELAERALAELGLLALLVPAGFLATVVRRPRYALLSGVAFVVTCLFDAAYVNAAIDRYYLGPLLLAVSWLGVGAAAVADTFGPGAGSAATADGLALGADPLALPPGPAVHPPGQLDPGSHSAAPVLPASRAALLASLAAAAVLAGPAILAAPGSFSRADHSRDVSARRWVDGTLTMLPDDALVQSWWSFSTPLWYATLVEGQRPDVTVVDDRDLLDENLGTTEDLIEANLRRRPVFVLRPDTQIADLARRWVLKRWDDPAGIQPVWQVVARHDAAP